MAGESDSSRGTNRVTDEDLDRIEEFLETDPFGRTPDMLVPDSDA